MGADAAFAEAVRQVNRGCALETEGKLDEALACYERAVRLNPDLPEAHLNVGTAQDNRGRPEQALVSHQRALALNPQLAEAHFGLARALAGLRRTAEAVASYERALALKPDYVAAQVNLGNALADLGRVEEAAAWLSRAVALAPNLAAAQCNLGNIRKRQGRLEEAAACYQCAIALQPSLAEAHFGLGETVSEQGRAQEAAAAYGHAVVLKPEWAEAHASLGKALFLAGRQDEAAQCFQRALELEPNCAEARLGALFATLPILAATAAESRAAPNRFGRALEAVAAWAGPHLPELGEAMARRQPFHLAYRGGSLRDLLSRYGDLQHAASQARWPAAAPPVRHDARHGRIRVGVVSAQIRRHSVWDIVLRGLVQHLDRDRFELRLYHTHRDTDDETRWAMQRVNRFVQGPKSVEAWVAEIAADRPQVLFFPEIGMDPITGSLAALRLATLQVASWGHPVTTGLPTIDVFLSGELLEPSKAQDHYRERLVRLPGTGACTEPLPIAAEPATSNLALPADRRVTRFALLHMPFKLDPGDDLLWARIARSAAPCQFWLAQDQRSSWASAQLLERLARVFRAEGLDPDAHLHMMPWLPRSQFLGLLDEMDVWLDSPAFSGYTTAWQAAQRGLPVLTLEGEFLRQRLAAGLLRRIGLSDTIVQTVDDYVALAEILAAECRVPESREKRRATVKQAAPQADGDLAVVRAIEHIFIDELLARLSDDDTAHVAPPSRKDETGMANSATPESGRTARPWEMLGGELHWNTLRHDYAPEGLLAMIEGAPRRVLDVGCFCGGTGRWLKQRLPGVTVIGVEPLGPAAALASEVYDRIIRSPVEAVDFAAERVTAGSLDAIICADVLEHLANPWQVLQRLKPLLAVDGALYVSLPNVRNLNVLAGLARGEWRYTGAGILDVTHLRFFTRTQAVEMLSETGWRVSEVRINADPSLMPAFADKDLGQIRSIQLSGLKLDDLTNQDVVELLALQFFIRAFPS